MAAFSRLRDTMRTFLRLLPCLVLLLCPLTVTGQSTSARAATVVVDIASEGISIFTENALNFGSVLAGSGVRTVAVTNPAAGKFRVQGRRNTNLNVTLSPPAVLTNGAASIPYTWQAAKNEDTDNPANVIVVAANHILRLRYRVSAQVGNAWLYIYGSINVSNAALPPGVYTGTFTVTAAYN